MLDEPMRGSGCTFTCTLQTKPPHSWSSSLRFLSISWLRCLMFRLTGMFRPSGLWPWPSVKLKLGRMLVRSWKIIESFQNIPSGVQTGKAHQYCLVQMESCRSLLKMSGRKRYLEHHLKTTNISISEGAGHSDFGATQCQGWGFLQ